MKVQFSFTVGKRHLQKSSLWLAYRATRVQVGSLDRDRHGVKRRFQENRELVGSGRVREVRVNGLEAYDLLEAVLYPETIQYRQRVNPIRICKNLQEVFQI